MAKSKNRENIRHVSSLDVIVELHRVQSMGDLEKGYGRRIPKSLSRNAGQYYIILKKRNGRTLYQSTDYYKRREGALHSVRSMFGFSWKGDYRDYSKDGETWILLYHFK